MTGTGWTLADPAGSAPAVETLGNWIGDQIGDTMSSWFDTAMKTIWTGCLDALGYALGVADKFSTFSISTSSGPIGTVWPTLLEVSGVIALGLFFWQITLSAVRGGAGMIHAATGPVAYGIALAMSVSGVAAVLGAADAISTLIFQVGLNVNSFSAAWAHTSLGSIALDGVKPVVLALVGMVGFFPAAFGFVLETIWRQATILVLVATIPITAAGLLAQSTASWFWRGLRWTLAAIVVKPALALIIVIGVLVIAGSTGPVELLAGAGVLWVALIAPQALFKMLAFVDPATAQGDAFHSKMRATADSLAGGAHRLSSSGGGGGGGGGGGRNAGFDDDGDFGEYEDATTARFGDGGSHAGSSSGGNGGSPAPAGNDDGDLPPPPPSGGSGGGSRGGGSSSGGDGSSGDGSAGGGPPGGGSPGGDGSGGGDLPPPPDPDPGPPDGGGAPRPPSGPSGGPSGGGPSGGGPGGGGPGGGAGGSEAAAAAETAAIL